MSIEDRVNAYEGLFLFPQSAAGHLREAVDHVKEILGRAGAEIISLRKWDERRLAYEIKGNKRGVYFLVYFVASPPALSGIERDCNLSERLLRSLVIRADHLTRDQMESADGQSELEDEIRLGDEETTGSGDGEAEADGDNGSKPVVEVQVEPVAKDTSTAVET